MQNENESKQISSQVMELKDLISGPLVATIDADSMSARRYLNYLLELTFESYDRETGKTGELRTLDFTYKTQDVDGEHERHVSIPLLTLVPLPLLQVKEADFDFDIQIVDAISADKDAIFSLKSNGSPEDETLGKGVKLRVSMAQSASQGSTSESIKKSISANMRVNIKMQQADMPGGLSNLLFLTTNNVQMKDRANVSGGKEVSHE